MVALVTGGAKNIGRSIVIEFAKNGYDVVINYNTSEEEAFELKRYVEDAYNVNALTIKCDISDEQQVKNMIEEIINKFNRIDVLVNNAALELNTEFDFKTKETFNKVLDVNLIGTFLVSKYVSKYMLKENKGNIINITSNNAINKNDPSTLEYDASKAAIISLTHNLAKHLAPNINVNAIAPGWVETNKIKELDNSLNGEFIKEESKKILKGRFAKEEEIASLVYYLTTNEYINDQVIIIDGGNL